jgi:hypothetical protein
MVTSMAKTEKVTVTLTVEQLAALRTLASRSPGATVSGLVQHAVAMALESEREFDAMVDDDLAASGGPLTVAEAAWVDGVLGVGPPAPLPDSFAERQRILQRLHDDAEAGDR